MKKKILLIDDEKDIIDMVKVRLEVGGAYEATTVYSGKEGVKRANSESFDLVITDFNMPDINGDQVLTEIKKKNPQLPVFIFSIYHDDDSEINPSLRARAAGIICKPIDYEQLDAMISGL